MKSIVMKKLFSIGALFSVCSLAGVATQDYTYNDSTRLRAQLMYEMNFQYFAFPIVITNPGVYALSQSVDFFPTGSNQAAVLITVNDVVIDLNNFSIYQDPSTSSITGAVGIQVLPGVSNVMIRGGTVTQMTGTGILIGDGCNTVQLYDLSIIDLQCAGIDLDGLSSGSGIQNVLLSNINVQNVANNSYDFYGFVMNNCAAINAQNCSCNSLSGLNNAYGYYMDTCVGARFKSCIESGVSAASTAFGYYGTNCDSVLFIDSVANDASAGDFAAGFAFDTCTAINCDSSSSFNHSSTSTAVGFNFNTCTACQALNCQGAAQSGDDVGIGFASYNGVNNSFAQSQAAANNGGGDGVGFLLNNEVGSAITECSAAGDSGLTGTSYGIQLVSTNSCVIVGNELTGHISGVAGYGVYDDAGAATTSSYYANVAIKNSVSFSPGSPTIDVYTGPLTVSPGTYENVALN